jgi:hypothetical protein
MRKLRIRFILDREASKADAGTLGVVSFRSLRSSFLVEVRDE